MEFFATILISGFLFPLLTSWLVNRSLQKRDEAYEERQETITLFLNEQQNFIEEKIDAFLKALELLASGTSTSFKRIEDLVNDHIQQMTQGELSSGEDTEAMMRAFAQGQVNIGIRPTAEMQKVIQIREARNQVLRDRLREYEKVD